jgi:hypothetical protein
LFASKVLYCNIIHVHMKSSAKILTSDDLRTKLAGERGKERLS